MSDTAEDTGLDTAPVLHGRVVDVSNLTYVSHIEVGIAAVRPDGEKVNVVVRTNDAGEFTIPLPPGPFVAARAAVGIDGPTPIELDVEDDEIVPGDVIFSIPPEQGTHLRFGGFA